MIRHLISCSHKFVTLFVLVLAFATTVLAPHIVRQHTAASAEVPTVNQVADGWGDPTGG